MIEAITQFEELCLKRLGEGLALCDRIWHALLGLLSRRQVADPGGSSGKEGLMKGVPAKVHTYRPPGSAEGPCLAPGMSEREALDLLRASGGTVWTCVRDAQGCLVEVVETTLGEDGELSRFNRFL